MYTLDNLLALVDLGGGLLHELVTLLANLYDLCAFDAKGLDGLEDLLGNGASILVLGEDVWVVESVV